MAAHPRELEDKLWAAIKSDRTMMIGLPGVEGGHARPMTAELDGDRAPIWFFTARDNTLVTNLHEGRQAFATFRRQGP